MSDNGLYFRVRDGGAQVFRALHDTKDGRLKLDPLAIVSLNSEEIRPQGARVVSEAETAEIRAWMDARKATLQQREVDDAERLIDAMQKAAHWVQSKGADPDVAQVEDALLMAAHDLRLAIVKRKFDRLDD